MRLVILYSETSPDGAHGLAVGISRYGLHAVQVDRLDDGRFLKQAGIFDWPAVRQRERCYSGDDGRGRLRQRLVAAAISLLAYHGGDEALTEHLDLSLPEP